MRSRPAPTTDVKRARLIMMPWVQWRLTQRQRGWRVPSKNWRPLSYVALQLNCIIVDAVFLPCQTVNPFLPGFGRAFFSITETPPRRAGVGRPFPGPVQPFGLSLLAL